MKKPVLATLGITGACAACCAFPLAIPLLSGLSAAGLVSLDWARLPLTATSVAVAAGAAVAAAVGLALWVARRRRPASACSVPVEGKSSGCGCAP